MTTVVKAASAAEFLSHLPRMLGYRPRRSLVLVLFSGSHSVGALRFDLPGEGDAPPGDPHDIASIAATAVGTVCRVPDADGFATVVCTDSALTAGVPHDELVAELSRRADASGLHVVDALCVASDGWTCYLDGPEGCGIRPLDELATDEGVLDEPLADDQSSAAVLPTADEERSDAVASALDGLTSAIAVLCGPDAACPRPGSPRVDPLALSAAVALDDLPALFESALGWDAASVAPFDAATLGWCLSRPALRDIALVQWCAGSAAGDEALDAQLRWEQGEEYPAHLAMFLWGEGDRPAPARLEGALDLVRHVAAVLPESARAGALATAAWMSWALGRSTHADRYARAALAVDAEHGLAEIVLSFVAAGHLPDWAFQRA